MLVADAQGLHHNIWGDEERSGVRVDAAPLAHPVQCIGYILTEAAKPGALDARRAAQFGVKGKDLGRLKAGEDVTVMAADGATTTLRASDFLSVPIPGRRVLLLGDTCDSSAVLLHGRGFHAIVHESTFDDTSAALALPRGHSTARMAGAFASAAGAERLLLTHFSQRFRPRSKDADAGRVMDEVEAQACDGFAIARSSGDTGRGEPGSADLLISAAGSATTTDLACSLSVSTMEDFSVVDLRRK